MAEKPKRKAVSIKTRFDIFKRDNFTCQYCSSKPPKVPLEIDHIIPVASGGTNDKVNLITACFDCNRGKGARELTLMPLTTVEKIERMQVAQKQYNQFKRILTKEKKIIEQQIDEVDNIYSMYNEGWSLSDKFRIQVKNFISKLGVHETCDAMEIACSKINHEQKVIKYFCGVCWNKIKNNDNGYL
jgi:5-methylcytosine-specific restriction endonuclease McrA